MTEEQKVEVKKGNSFSSAFKGTLGKGLGCIALIIIIGVVGALMSPDSDNSNESEKVSENNQEQIQETQEEKTVFKVGDEIKNNDKVLIVNSVQDPYTNYDEYSAPEPGKRYIVVNITLKNDGNTDMSYNPLDFQIENSDGVLDNYDWLTVSDGFSAGELRPNGKVTGNIPFLVPADDNKLKLVYRASWWFDQEIVVELY